MTYFYYKRDGTPYPNTTEGRKQFAKDFGNPETQIVNKTRLWNGYEVSTIWLGVNHCFKESEDPLIFETMVFPQKRHYYQERFSTEQQAKEGHERAVKKFRFKLPTFLTRG